MSNKNSIAVVGIGGIFPDAPNPRQFWDNILKRRDASRTPPEGRWYLSENDAFDPEVGKADKVYSKKACYVDPSSYELDYSKLNISPDFVRQLDPMFHLALYAGDQAFKDAGAEKWDTDRMGVIMGNLVLPSEMSSALAREYLGRTFEEKVLSAEVISAEDAEVTKINPLNRYVAGLPAGLLARALNLGGGAYTLDAACASSLYALKLAADELIQGRADAMIAGGLSRPDSLYTQMGFSQLRALSQSGTCSPFDAKGDGLVVGEGCGLFVLKRTADAVRDGDRIYAVIKGIGLSNDVGGRLLAPTSEGQLRAMSAAYEQAGWDPREVDLIECHATGTPVGDAVEFESLKTLWNEAATNKGWTRGQCVLGSVKSNIGHLLTAAGSAALMKTIFALREKTLPPTANFVNAPDALGIEESPFKVLKEPLEWKREDNGTPRKAAISAFGFGGINAHVLVEEWLGPKEKKQSQKKRKPKAVVAAEPVDIAIVGMDAHFGPWDSLRAVQERVLGCTVPEEPYSKADWWGVEKSGWFKHHRLGRVPFNGFHINDVRAAVDQFRIPPKELEEMLPQQLLMLRVAERAWNDAGLKNEDNPKAGVFVGLGLDLNTTNFHFRWSIQNKIRTWARQLDLHLSEEELEQWLADLRDAAGPPLTANRTMGGLGSVVASRIARELHIGGPSFTLSSEENSAVSALNAAVRTLQSASIDCALVGGVEMAGDVRAVLARHAKRACSYSGKAKPFDSEADGTVMGEGATAIVLKRLKDAQRDGDRVYAVIKGIGTATGGKPDDICPSVEAYTSAMDRAYAEAGLDHKSIGYIEAHGSACPREDAIEAAALTSYFKQDVADQERSASQEKSCALGSSKGDLGHTGCAAGLASVVKAAMCLYQEIIPPLRNFETARSELDLETSRLYAPEYPQYWLRNRSDGPRRAAVSSLSVDGNCAHVVLEAAETSAIPSMDVAKRQPMGAHHEALFAVTANTTADLLEGLDALRSTIENAHEHNIEALARRWLREREIRQRDSAAVAMVARAATELLEQISFAHRAISEKPHERIGADGNASFESFAKDRIFYSPKPMGPKAKLAFVFPGSGNHYPGMGRELFTRWTEVLRRQDAENEHLRSQFQPEAFWTAEVGKDSNLSHKTLIFGQVALGTAVSDLMRVFGVNPGTVIGYSLGETAGLFALGAWTNRDEMLTRINGSELFTTELAGDCTAARKSWKLPKHEAVDWVLGVIDRPMKVAKATLKHRKKVYPLIANTLQESVIGGNRKAVQKLITQLECQFVPLDGVTTVHCEIVKEVEKAYRELHLFDNTRATDIEFYSGAWGKTYEVTSESTADSILAQALNGVDFPKVVENAYEDGVRFFVEMGPGSSCSRMVTQILAKKPHMARSVCCPGHGEVSLVLRTLANLVAERMPVNLDHLYGHDSRAVDHSTAESLADVPQVVVPIGGKAFVIPEPSAAKTYPEPQQPPAPVPSLELDELSLTALESTSPLAKQIADAELARVEAHEKYIKLSAAVTESMAQNIAFQMSLIQRMMGYTPDEELPNGKAPANVVPFAPTTSDEVPRALNREQCMEFAIGLIGNALGPRFADVDSHPTRVRLPDEPLMLVDRIVGIEGEPLSMTSGRVVTEHDVLRDGWYLDSGRMPTCIAVEAGQADLFLSGYLGIDFKTKGLAMYRLLDAEVTFHRHLPLPGEVVKYDIHIDRFFRHGNPYFFHFRFDSTVGGQPFLSMRNGCAGFFTNQELDAGQGIVDSTLAMAQKHDTAPHDRNALVPMSVEKYDEAALEQLRAGDLAACFGTHFVKLGLSALLTIPGGKMHLVDRVIKIDPDGGKYGMGIITAEADIHPDDWFLTCHFSDDRVMPGTLMYECCLHTLRVFLMRMGWLSEDTHTVWEPVPGVTSRLKCRGQVLETTKKVTYEVSIKELGYRPEPYAIADAKMYSDGKPTVAIDDMSIQLSGATRETIEGLWKDAGPVSLVPKPPVYDNARILAFAIGKPSEAFGDRYEVFDSERKIARLPGPPYDFLTRVTGVSGEAWELASGTTTETQYDVPADAWYFASNRQSLMPFAVLLEVALQPCGWLAAYMGSALTSETDLKFRNLGGSAVQYLPVTPDTEMLQVNIKTSNVSSSGGMIIQNFDMKVTSAEGLVYEGTTYFGFFSHSALADQIGIRDAKPYEPNQGEIERASSFDYPPDAPFQDDMLRMIDRIEIYVQDGGPKGLGFIRGTKDVDPDDWFFKAHFYQDPVCPGSLGLESFLQLLKVVAAQRWNLGPGACFETIALNEKHEWIYRGQVIPSDKTVTVEAVVTKVDDDEHLIFADGFLIVDGRIIYQMLNFSLRIVNK